MYDKTKIFIIFVLALGFLTWTFSPIAMYSNVHKLNVQEMLKKKCSTCGEIKLISDFTKHKNCKLGVTRECKDCSRIKSANYRHTKKGLIYKTFHNQKKSSLHRNHPLPIYTINELLDFALKSPEFHRLYDNWVEDNYGKMSRPSFDRADDSKGYSFDNFNKWMTWDENLRKGHSDRKNGKIIGQSKSVIGVHIITGEVIYFHSMKEAQRHTGIKYQNISLCCMGRQPYAGNYDWRKV